VQGCIGRRLPLATAGEKSGQGEAGGGSPVVDRREFLGSGVKLTAVLGASQLDPGPAHADAGGALKSTGSPWPLRNSEAFEFYSNAVGDRMAVGVWSHPGSNPARSAAKGPPLDVVYILDGSFALAVAATICLLQAVDLINPGYKPVLLVGVDYPDDKLNARSRDYTMKDSVSPSLSKALSATPQTTPGGADKFLAFLENELDPIIRSKYNTTDKPAGIIGDSFGGTFTFYAFLQQSKLFDRYWLGSPGIFTTAADYVTQFEACLKKKFVHPTKMFLSMGSREMAAGIDMYEDMGRNFNLILSALKRNPSDDLVWSSKVYDGYTHTAVFMPSMNDALIYLYGNHSTTSSKI
jgi:predicted alpha/beta superfamily hydrolase